MPEIKKIKTTYTSGATIEVTVIRDADGYLLDHNDGAFKVSSTPGANFRVPLAENAAVTGFFERDESRAAWDAGAYTIVVYENGITDPVGVIEMSISGDLEVTNSVLKTAVDDIHADVADIHTDLAAVAGYIDTEITTILDRIGAFTGTGVNTILGFFKALFKKDAAIPSDIGGTFDPATDSTEAIAEKLVSGVTVNPASITAGVLSGVVTVGSTVKWAEGTADRLTVSLGSAYAKAEAKFYLIIKATAETADGAAILNREITITDPATVEGYIDLTSAEMAVVGNYFSKIRRTDADGVSNPKTCWKASWWIYEV